MERTALTLSLNVALRVGQIQGRSPGPWAAGPIAHVDEDRRRIWFVAYGREEGILPYYRQLYTVGFDGSGLRRVSETPGRHQVEFSPSGDYFVDVRSRIEEPPVSVLRSGDDGEPIRTLEEADVTLLEEAGWAPADTFRVKARDGVTDIYGVIFLPPDYDPAKEYPVIERIYPGPQVGSVGSWSFEGGGEPFALARLGFIVVETDHMGTPYRSKAFHDIYYRDFIDNGIPDHIAALKQLAGRYPGMDLERVGIYGHSGGGFASTDALLRFPDFYSVAVSGSGNHDNRSYNIHWSEKYQGFLHRLRGEEEKAEEGESSGEEGGSSGEEQTEDDLEKRKEEWKRAANPTYADQLEGKLLLMHGDMDDNVHPAMTVQLIDALTKANKDYDLVWAPDRDHGLHEPYFIRQRWDYFVRHLMGAEAPKEYDITKPENP